VTTVIVVGIVVLALVNFAFKAAGPALLMDAEPSPTVQDLVISLSPALLTGLVVVELAGPHWSHLDWTALPPLAVAAVAYRKGVPDLVCLLIAVGLTAGLRALF
jgi:Branched-chain amino acid transport protein (AzlD)